MNTTNALSLSYERKTFLKCKSLQKVFAFFIVLTPILLPYRFPFTSYSMSTILSLMLALIGIVLVWLYKSKVALGSILFLLLFFLYALFNSSTTVALSFAITIVILLSLTTGYINEKHLRKYLETISVIATIAVLLQTVVYYLVGKHPSLIVLNFCTNDIQEQYHYLVSTGISDGHYRPSAFFLEPAHYSQFSIFGLASCLFKHNRSVKKALIITLGIIATTSGMGIALSIITWAFWAIIYNWKWIKKHLIHFFGLLILAFTLVILLYQIPSVKFAVGRILGTSGDMSAIQGRLFFWESYFGQFTVKDLVYGFGQATLPDVYFTSFMVYLWAYGIVGLSLYAFACFQLFVTSKLLAKYLVLVIFVLTFFANQANIAGMVFNFGIIISLRKERYLI